MQVDPADVVSVPVDCECGKLRACKITPINVCKAEYDTAVVVDEDEDNTDTIITNDAADDVYMIKRVPYVCTYITDADFEYKRHDTAYNQLVRVRPSKAPKALRDNFDIKICYRYILNKQDAPVYLVCTDDDTFMTFTKQTEETVDVNDDVDEVIDGDVNEVQEVVSIARKPHLVYKLSEIAGKGIFEGETLHIRPSKYPVAIKNMFSDKTVVCKRVVNPHKSEYVVHNEVDDVYYLFVEK